jgi:hypothetical protein
MLKILGRIINRYLTSSNKDCDNPDKSPLMFMIGYKTTLWDGIIKMDEQFIEFLNNL